MTSMVRSLSLTARRRRGGPAVLPAGVFPAVLGAFWPAAVVAVCLALAAQPALAQDVEDQLQRLPRHLPDLQRPVHGGAAPPAPAGGDAPTAPPPIYRIPTSVVSGKWVSVRVNPGGPLVP